MSARPFAVDDACVGNDGATPLHDAGDAVARDRDPAEERRRIAGRDDEASRIQQARRPGVSAADFLALTAAGLLDRAVQRAPLEKAEQPERRHADRREHV
jgi:hypothetical protein